MNTKSKKDITVIKGAKGWMGSDSGGQSSFKVKGGSVTIKPGQTKTIRLVTSESGFDPGGGLSYKYCGHKISAWYKSNGKVDGSIILGSFDF